MAMPEIDLALIEFSLSADELPDMKELQKAREKAGLDADFRILCCSWMFLNILEENSKPSQIMSRSYLWLM